MSFETLINPRLIAVIGASSNLQKPGGKVFYNILTNGYQGKLFPVNPHADFIQGCKNYRSITELPETPDLAILSIPATFIPSAMSQLASMGTKAMIVLSAGFGELNNQGKRLEQELKTIADSNNITLIGPNCMGIISPAYAGVFAGPIPQLKKNSIDFISASGATAAFILEEASLRNLPISHVFTVGNSAQKSAEDILEALNQRDVSKPSPLIMMYLENIVNPKKLIKNANGLLNKGVQIVAIKSGSSKEGEKAASSHTGAIANNDCAVDALFKKAGIIRVYSRKQLIDVAGILQYTKPTGKRICIVTHAGGPGVLLTDELSKQKFQIATLSSKTKSILRANLQRGSSVENPIDFLASGTASELDFILNTLQENDAHVIDHIIVIFGSTGLFDVTNVYRTLIKHIQTNKIPVIPLLPSPVTAQQELSLFKEQGMFLFHEETDLAKALAKLFEKTRYEERHHIPTGFNESGIKEVLENIHGILTPEDTFKILHLAGFRVPAQAEVASEDDLIQALQAFTFPIVMKVIGPLHKSDSDGVTVGIQSLNEAKTIRQKYMSRNDVTSVLIQEMIQGHEMILGAIKDEPFGHLVMCGIGGIYTEILNDVQFSLTPVHPTEALSHINNLKSIELLKGARGKKPVSIEMFAEAFVRIGHLVHQFPEIKEIDINPLKGFGEHLTVVDARIIL